MKPQKSCPLGVKIIMPRKIMSGLTGRYVLVALLLLVLWALSVGPAARLMGARASTGVRIVDSASHTGEAAPPSLSNTRLPVRPTLTEIADSYIADMSLDQELGQLFIGAFSGTDYNASNAEMVEQQGIGGMLLYTVNMTGKAQTSQLIATAQAHAQIPMLVMTDEEGGYVDRLQQFYGWRPTATEIGATNNRSYAEQQGNKAGQDMAALGFNADFAPDVDVQQIAGPDQITRTFGTTPQQVTTMAGAWMTGMQSAGVAVCLKHFPGLGDATTDAHKDLPVINETEAQIEDFDLAPYRSLIATGQVQMIMATDLLMPALDPTMPAELSPKIITGVLRDELGYNGVVVTDALYMQGVLDRYSMAQAAALAIEAGDDLLVGAFNAYQLGLMRQALKQALASGHLTRARIDESVRRILMLKMRMGILPIPTAVQVVAPIGSMEPHLGSWPSGLLPRQPRSGILGRH
jgi:beta-N-acetylhexosaminidase